MNFHIGDSVTMILKAKDLFEENLHTPVPHFLSPDEKVKLNFKLSEIQSSNEFFAELITFMHWFDGDIKEGIKGLELTLGQMREGDKALVIVPHRLAFGAMGAGDGIVPANTPVIYELELLLAQNLN